VGHVHEQQRAHRLRDCRQPFEIDHPCIGTGAGHDHLRAVLAGQSLDLVVVELLGFRMHSIGHELVHSAGEIQRVTVCQVASVGQVHAQHRIARLQRGHVDRDVGLCAGVRLYVDVLGAEQLLGAVDGQLFGAVYEFAPAVVAPARVAFGVFVREDRPHRFEHGFRDEIFRSDQLEPGGLPADFGGQNFRDFRVHFRQGALDAFQGFRFVCHAP
jgi:hypothetical protein